MCSKFLHYFTLSWPSTCLRLLCIKSDDAASRHADITESPKIKSKSLWSLKEESSSVNRKMITPCAMLAKRRCASSHRVAVMNVNWIMFCHSLCLSLRAKFKLPGLPPHCRLFLFLFRGFFTVWLRSTPPLWLHLIVSHVNWLVYFVLGLCVKVEGCPDFKVLQKKKICNFSSHFFCFPLILCPAEGFRFSVNRQKKLWITIVYKGTKKRLLYLSKLTYVSFCKTGFI